MSLTLYFHPLSSYCMKALVGLYELDVPFDKQLIDLGNDAERAAFAKVWPLAKFPVLSDSDRGEIVPESTIVLEYAAERCGRSADLIPSDPLKARRCRLRDRFFDLYVNAPMGKIVTDKLRPSGEQDRFGVDQARRQLEIAYDIAESWDDANPWAVGEAFTLADCAAAPALRYADLVVPIGDRRPRLAAYLARLNERPSFARAWAEAAPYRAMFPG